ncbi:SDR family oxidoreductase [Nocardioides nematodiphilus]|uniref:SDR family oxidoreductase n=1 Tax=Nocardioides nematodiphilus TaxID=2849669 RepID=UPI001CD9A825|nr:SDR family oxidoreductase [Nocardioides nematodiphilus]MCA1982386.1 SDR family oxidoreductase [Nocardioides nematodiphilus]
MTQRRHLITGAGSGIGRVLAQRLLERGDEVHAVVRTAGRAPEGCIELVADLADDAAVAALDLPGELDTVLHVAGVVELASVAEISAAGLREQLDVNLIAPVLLTRAALPALRAARGLVVFVNSSAGLSASPSWSAYAASKFGLRAVADALRAEEQASGVRVTTVFPSRTATPMQEKVHEQEGGVYDAARWIRPETVVDTILHVIDLPRDATIPDVTIRPLVPRPNAS